MYSTNTIHKYDLHMLNANFTTYQKGACYTEMILFNTLPTGIKSLNNDVRVFKPALKDGILFHSCCLETFSSIHSY